MTYKPQIIIPLCPNCQAELVKKTNDKGEDYYACPNWKPRNMGCKGYFWSPTDGSPKIKPEVIRSENPTTRDTLLMEEIQQVNKRITKLGSYLVEKFGEILDKLQ